MPPEDNQNDSLAELQDIEPIRLKSLEGDSPEKAYEAMSNSIAESVPGLAEHVFQ